MESMDEIVKEFLVESYDNLDQLDRDLVALEDAPDDRNRLSSIFRTIHTIKGTCGFLGFPILEHVTHVGESLLVRLRDGELRLDAAMTNGLLATVDAVRTILSMIETTGSEGDNHYEPLVETLDLLRKGQVTSPPSNEQGGRQWLGQISGNADGLLAESFADHSNGDGPGSHDGSEMSISSSLEDLENLVSDLSTSTAGVKKNKRTRKPSSDKSAARAISKSKTSKKGSSSRPSRSEPTGPKILVRDTLDPIDSAFASGSHPSQGSGTSAKRDTSASASSPSGSTDSGGLSDSAEKSGALSDSTVRLDVSLLDRLMNLVGELVLARNQILQYSRNSEDAVIIAASQRLNLITAELQEGIMKTRMQPIQNAWSRLPRVVRDLSASFGKKVQIKMDGAETELDKTILEAIKDPLTHIVRNSVDHGIELPAVREANGKPGEGTLSLRAFHEGGQVNIEISDDGAGINLTRVREKAIQQGMVTAEQASMMSDRELTQLILLPGFSTAARVTNVSGRGVGMDVVKTNVEKIGGTLDIQSVAGRGTTMRIKIPLTLAIVPGLTVTCGGDCYCIPQASLLELVRLEDEHVAKEIEQIHNVPVYRLRGNLLPLMYLDEQLGLRSKRTHDERRAEEAVNIVVLQAEDKPFGLVVDSVTDMQEIVVKPLGVHLKGIPAYAGTTIMGDGAVSLILDVAGLAREGGVLNEQRDHVKTDSSSALDGRGHEQHSWLIVDPGDGTRAAISLDTIARLEEFRMDDIERCGDGDVVQYRGKIMPLMRLGSSHLGNWADSGRGEELEQFPVVVFQSEGRQVGIVVGQIVDIVEHALDSSVNSHNPVNAQIICGRVTRVIDLGAMVSVAV